MAKKLSEEVKARRKVRRTIESKGNFLDKPNREDYRSIVFTFLEKYFLCEIGTKKAIMCHDKIKPEIPSSIVEKSVKKKSVENKDEMELAYNSIEKKLRELGFEVDHMNIDEMFKKKEKKGEKSARDLRNKIVHEMSVNDIQEVVDRWDYFEQLLDNYIDYMCKEPLE